MKKYILLAAVAISLTACNNDDNYIDDPVAVHISATIGESSVTRAGDTSWDPGDCIGISMSGRYNNVKYVAKVAKDDKDDKVSFEGPIMYFKNKREPVTISAYYPYVDPTDQTPALIEASTSAERQTAEEQPKFNFMFASMEGVTGADPNVKLEFSHQMSKLTLVFKNEAADPNKEDTPLDVVRLITSYTIEGLILDGTFNPATGECTAKSEAAQPITMNLTEVTSGEAVPSLLLFPQTVDKLTLRIKDSENQDYACELKFTDTGLVSGNNYQFEIIVKKTILPVVPSINPWTVVTNEDDKDDDKTAWSDD